MEHSTFSQALLAFSDEGVDFERARLEWRMRLPVDGERFACLCGRSAKGLGCLAEHMRTGRLIRVGSCCASKHLGWDARGLASELASLSKNTNHPMREALANFCHGVGWISEWEHDFCVATSGVAKPTSEQQAKRVEINRKASQAAARDAATASTLPTSTPPDAGPIVFG